MSWFNSTKNNVFEDEPHGEFWHGFSNHIKKNSTLRHFGSLTQADKLYDLPKVVSFSGCDVGIINKPNYRHIWLAGGLNPTKSWLSAKLTIPANSNENHKDLFDSLLSDKYDIEKLFQTPYKFEWDDPPIYSIGILREGINLHDKNSWPELFEWLRTNLEKLEHVIINRFALYFYEIKANRQIYR